MATDDAADDTGLAGESEAGDGADSGRDATGVTDGDAREEARGAVDRIDGGTGDVAGGVDDRLVDLLSWLLDTETKARIFVRLRERPGSTSEEVAEGTGLYPSTVREALAELHADGIVTRTKRESSGAGNNPYEYESIPPADLVEDAVGRVQTELNTVFNLDRRLGRASGEETDPVTITVDGTGSDAAGGTGTPTDTSDAADDGRPDAE